MLKEHMMNRETMKLELLDNWMKRDTIQLDLVDNCFGCGNG